MLSIRPVGMKMSVFCCKGESNENEDDEPCVVYAKRDSEDSSKANGLGEHGGLLSPAAYGGDGCPIGKSQLVSQPKDIVNQSDSKIFS